MNYLELIARAEQFAAGVGQDALLSPVVDSTVTAETIFPHAMRFVIGKMAESGQVDDLVSAHTIPIAAGVGVLPDNVLKATKDDWKFTGRNFVTIVPYHDFQRYKFTAQIDYFALDGKTIHYKRAGINDFTGTLTLSAPSIPEISGNTDAQIPLSSVTLESVILMIASVLRGEKTIESLIEY